MLEIQQLAVNYGREYKRKDRLLRDFLSGNETEGSIAVDTESSIEMKDATMTAMEWPDTVTESYVDHTLGTAV